MIKLTGNLLKEAGKLVETKAAVVKHAIAEELSAVTPVKTGYAQSRWKVNASGNITNDADYVDELNAGSSQQAPAYFIESTLLSHPGVKPNGTIVRSNT